MLEAILCFTLMILALTILATACVVAVELVVRWLKLLVSAPTDNTAEVARQVQRGATDELDRLLGRYQRRAHGLLNDARRARSRNRQTPRSRGMTRQ